jgi:hypothetical protein
MYGNISIDLGAVWLTGRPATVRVRRVYREGQAQSLKWATRRWQIFEMGNTPMAMEAASVCMHMRDVLSWVGARTGESARSLPIFALLVDGRASGEHALQAGHHGRGPIGECIGGRALTAKRSPFSAASCSWLPAVSSAQNDRVASIHTSTLPCATADPRPRQCAMRNASTSSTCDERDGQ